ncbi:MAG: 30S ribosomal protein S8 [Candidatus Magasanikbacteria bacterium GW2011_GWA2_50_22]|uniref:Small ribosomal subunit protein uS8 n=1 Tax=Candidatus Magasanikbacteria bacterium GW2011_GWA2_50_22 TaxID=1619043 RepID=A0A0G1WFT0_9BACT|nr:MAG: 30S ribosomal protein S8 [Candidatus Magasanikbacteria bacterium GW2011_GWA2_50_22]
MMTDPIADMLTRIRNASLVHKKEAAIPFSKMKKAIADILVREGYIVKAEEGKTKPLFLMVTLKYADGLPAIQEVKRVSTPGHRRYVKTSDIDKVLNGLGLAIISTPRGLLTDKEARAAKVGGELICEIY